jgi:hypothetical protein
MKPSDNGHARFQVSISGVVAKQLKEFLQAAVQAGDEDRVLAAVREMHEKLEDVPGVFGGPLYHLQSLSLDMRLGIVPPLAVTYGVNFANRTVFISRIIFLEK